MGGGGRGQNKLVPVPSYNQWHVKYINCCTSLLCVSTDSRNSNLQSQLATVGLGLNVLLNRVLTYSRPTCLDNACSYTRQARHVTSSCTGCICKRNSQQEYRKCRIYHGFQAVFSSFFWEGGRGGEVSQPQAKCVFYVMMACRASTGKLRQTRNVFNVASVRTIRTNFSS